MIVFGSILHATHFDLHFAGFFLRPPTQMLFEGMGAGRAFPARLQNGGDGGALGWRRAEKAGRRDGGL